MRRSLATIHETAISRGVIHGLCTSAGGRSARQRQNMSRRAKRNGVRIQARRNFMRGILLAAIIALCTIAVGTAPLPASGEPTRIQRTDQSAFASFNKAIANYVRLKERLRGEIPPSRVTDNSAEIVARSDAWARGPAIISSQPPDSRAKGSRAPTHGVRDGSFMMSPATPLRRQGREVPIVHPCR